MAGVTREHEAVVRSALLLGIQGNDVVGELAKMLARATHEPGQLEQEMKRRGEARGWRKGMDEARRICESSGTPAEAAAAIAQRIEDEAGPPDAGLR